MAGSFLAVLPAASRARLAESATIIQLPAGRLLYEPEVAVVASGLLRAFLASADGRQLTLTYLRPHAAVGLTAAAGRAHPVAFQAMIDTRLLRWGREELAEVRRAHPDLGWAAAEEIAARLDEVTAALDRVAFGDLRARVAHHLLALADGLDGAPVPAAAVTAAVGSVREVIARILGALRAEGLVEAGPVGVRIVDADGLDRIAEDRPVGPVASDCRSLRRR